MAKRKNVVKSARITTLSPLRIRLTRRMGKHSRSVFSCGPGSTDLDYPISPSLKIHRLAWRIVSLRHREGRTMWRESVSPRS
jgi:hypothetical protein